MHSTGYKFTDADKEAVQKALTERPDIGISSLARIIGRGKEAAKELRELVRGEIALTQQSNRTPQSETNIPISILQPHPLNTRFILNDDKDILELSANIKRFGLKNPISVKSVGHNVSGALLVTNGMRRLAALKVLNVATVAVIFVDISDREVFERMHSDDRTQKPETSYERALRFQRGTEQYSTLTEQAEALGMKLPTLTKALTPAQLPPCIMSKITDPRKIGVKLAAEALAYWKRDKELVESRVAGPLPASDAASVLGLAIGCKPRVQGRSITVSISRAGLEDAMATIKSKNGRIPEPLMTLILRSLQDGC